MPHIPLWQYGFPAPTGLWDNFVHAQVEAAWDVIHTSVVCYRIYTIRTKRSLGHTNMFYSHGQQVLGLLWYSVVVL